MNYENINLNIYDYVLENNKNVLNRCAIDFFGRTYTFREFKENVELCMKGFQELGLKEKDNIVILGLATPEFVFTMYALAKMGVAFNVLNPMDTSSYDEIIERLQPKYAMCLDLFYPLLKGKIEDEKMIINSPTDSLPLPIRTISKSVDFLKGKYVSIPSICYRFKELILLGKNSKQQLSFSNTKENTKVLELGTGGSSGIPKQVGISHEMLNNIIYQHQLMNESDCFDVSFEDNQTFLDIIPPHLGYGICDIHLALSLRLKLCLEPDPNPKKFVSQLIKHKPHHVLAGPVHWKELIAYQKKLDLHNLINAVSGGEHLENDDEINTNKKLKENGSLTTVREGVGLTEIGGVGTYNSSGDLFTVGRPLPEYTVGIFKVDMEDEEYDNTKLEDELCSVHFEKQEIGNFQIVMNGKNSEEITGEICYQLPVKILGYVDEKNHNENNMLMRLHEDGKIWIHTGDIGYINQNNNVIITERLKRVFNRNGWKIYPRYLSSIVSDSGLVKECTVIKRKSNDKGEANVPILYVVLKQCNIENETLLKDWCQKKFTGNYQLYDIIFVEELPKTGAGKIDWKLVEVVDSMEFPVARSENIEIEQGKAKKITLNSFYKYNRNQV